MYVFLCHCLTTKRLPTLTPKTPKRPYLRAAILKRLERSRKYWGCSISHRKTLITHVRNATKWTASPWSGDPVSAEPIAVAYITVVALFGAHLQLTGTLQYQLPFLPVFATGFHFPLPEPERRTAHSHLEYFIPNAATAQACLYLLDGLLCHLPFTPGARRWKRHRHFVIWELKALLLF